ncbi:MAG: TonB-dependent receptor, partial [Polymorphobacter sp.]
GAKPYVTSTELKRTGVIGTLEYTPNDNFSTVADIYWSKFDDTQTLRGIEFPLQWSSAALAPGYTASNGRITSGTFNGVKAVVRNDANARDAENLALGWNARFSKDGWTAFTDVSYSHVTRNDTILETYSGTGPAGSGPYDNLGFSTNSNWTTSFNPSVNYADPALIKLTSPQGWGGNVVPGGQVGYVNYPTVDDELFAWRTSFDRELDLGIFKSLGFGFNYADRTKSLTQDEYFLALKNGALSQPVPAGQLLAPTKLGFLGVPGMISYDPIALVSGGTYDLLRNPNADVLTKGWDVSEQVMTGYAQLNIDTPVGANTLTGNIGVQVINTNQRSNGAAASGSPAFSSQNVTGGAEYTYALPSLNLSLRTPEQFVARFGMSRQMARARLDQMRASINFNYNPALAGQTDPEFSPWGGNGGNPTLRPWLADAVDVSFEKYFGPVAYIAVAGFYKNLKTSIYEQQVLYDFSGFPVESGPPPVLNVGYVSIPTNGNGGNLYGVEFSGTLPFNVMSEKLDGFGLIGNFSITESNIQPNPNNPASPIPGLSEYVGNATFYFEKSGFQARVSVSYRSEFLGEVAGFGNGRTFRTVDPETLVDAQIGYEFQPGSQFAGLSVLLQGQNLNNEPFVTYQGGDTQQVIDNQNFGRRFLLGVGYKFGMNK